MCEQVVKLIKTIDECIKMFVIDKEVVFLVLLYNLIDRCIWEAKGFKNTYFPLKVIYLALKEIDFPLKQINFSLTKNIFVLKIIFR